MIRLSKYINVTILLTFLSILLFSTRFANQTVQSSLLDEDFPTQPTISATSPSVPLMFIENVGQFDEGARFQAWGGTSTMWLAEDALWITMFEAEDVGELGELSLTMRGMAPTGEPTNPPPRRAVNLKLSFVEANPQPEIEPFDRLETYFNYFRGNDPDKWRSHVPAWGGVRYKEIYPGIDLELTSENGHAVQRLVARSGANLDAVRLRVDGADEMELLTASNLAERSAALRASTAIGNVTLPLFALVRPDGTPLDIARPPTIHANQINAPFAPSVPTTTRHLLDPTLGYSTFIGGSRGDSAFSLALTAAGEAVVTGYTYSANFPTSIGAYDSFHNGDGDVFVLKLSADGGTLAYSTFIGGSGFDSSDSLAVTAAGEAIVTGDTLSADFPTSGNAYDSSYNGSRDLFVLKLSADGGTLAYSTFLGSSDADWGYSLAVTAVGEAVVTGYTLSADFPTSANAYDTSHNGENDVFVLKLSADGGALAYSTFIGGSSNEYTRSLVLTAAGEAVVTGYTGSADFPTSANAYDSSHNGNEDVFVSKLSPDGGTLIYSTFIGGSNQDAGESLTLTAAGEVVLTGETNSANFPTSANAYDTSHNGEDDVFVLKLSADGGRLVYSTFIGGSDSDDGESLTLTAAGELLLTGDTNSANFPTSANAYDTSHNGEYDVFVLKLSADGETLTYSTFIGGSGLDNGRSLALKAAGEVFLTGTTSSANFPTSANAYDSSHNGESDVFVLRLDGLGTPVLDPYESDDSCGEASSISSDGTVQDHTFHAAGDVDWGSFEAVSGTEYLIEARTPDESVADVVLEVHGGCGELPSASQGHAFSPDIRLRFTAPQSGSLYVRLNNNDGSVGGGHLSYQLSVRALADSASPGAVVLVAGRLRVNDSLQDEIHEVTNQVYRLFKANGYDDERIFYLATDLSLDADGDGVSDVDAQASRDNVQAAITSWAVDKVGPDRAFTLYLMDHGGINELFLNGETNFITPNDVDGWLDRLEAEAPGVRVNVVVEACHAGSFIGAPQSLSQPGRVVMASTGIYNLAYPSESGAFFSDALVAALGRGASLYGAFSEAQSAANQAHPDQTPWLDGDGDGVPNESQDGQEAQVRGFAYAGTLSGEEVWPPHIASAEIGPIEEGTGVISADVRDDRTILSVTAIIYKPSYTLPDQNAQEMPQEKVPALALRDTDGDGIYRATYENFDEAGTYRIVLYALDGDEQQARPKELTLEVSVGNELYLPLIIGR